MLKDQDQAPTVLSQTSGSRSLKLRSFVQAERRRDLRRWAWQSGSRSRANTGGTRFPGVNRNQGLRPSSEILLPLNGFVQTSTEEAAASALPKCLSRQNPKDVFPSSVRGLSKTQCGEDLTSALISC